MSIIYSWNDRGNQVDLYHREGELEATIEVQGEKHVVSRSDIADLPAIKDVASLRLALSNTYVRSASLGDSYKITVFPRLNGGWEWEDCGELLTVIGKGIQYIPHPVAQKFGKATETVGNGIIGAAAIRKALKKPPEPKTSPKIPPESPQPTVVPPNTNPPGNKPPGNKPNPNPPNNKPSENKPNPKPPINKGPAQPSNVKPNSTPLPQQPRQKPAEPLGIRSRL